MGVRAALYCQTHVAPEDADVSLRTVRLGVAGAVILLAVGAVTADATASAPPVSSVTHVWTEPASGYGFLDSAILDAHHSIDMSMYELADTTLEHDLMAKAASGVDVRVLLDSDYNGARDNASSYALLHASDVHVVWASPNQIFHAKYVVVDGVRAYVGTGNLASRDYSSTRDFWVEDTTPGRCSRDHVHLRQRFRSRRRAGAAVARSGVEPRFDGRTRESDWYGAPLPPRGERRDGLRDD